MPDLTATIILRLKLRHRPTYGAHSDPRHRLMGSLRGRGKEGSRIDGITTLAQSVPMPHVDGNHFVTLCPCVMANCTAVWCINPRAHAQYSLCYVFISFLHLWHHRYRL